MLSDDIDWYEAMSIEFLRPMVDPEDAYLEAEIGYAESHYYEPPYDPDIFLSWDDDEDDKE